MNTTASCFFLAAACLFARAMAGAADFPPRLFQESFVHPLGTYWCEQNQLTTADLDSDGHKDIVMMQTSLARTSGPPWSYICRGVWLRGRADGGYNESVITNYPGRYGYGAMAADLNRDGSPDLVLREQSLTHVLLNNGQGVFREVWTGTPGYYGVTAVDANRDGFPDLVSGTQTGGGGLIELFLNNGSGTRFTRSWSSGLYGSSSDAVQNVVVLNLNGDAHPDLVSREIYQGLLISHLGAGNGPAPFVQNSVMTMDERTFALAGGRLNGDSVDDVAAYVGWGQVRVFLNQGDGTLTNHWQSPSLGEAAFNLALADFDGDGANDIFVGTFGDAATRKGTARIYRNLPGGGFQEWWQQPLAGAGYAGNAADMNGDGRPDLILCEVNRSLGVNTLRILLNLTGRIEIQSVLPSAGGIRITWHAAPELRCRVEFKNGLEDTTWAGIGEAVTGADATGSLTDTTAGSESRRFYRVVRSDEQTTP